ncbi:hypothetical protein FNV43_RR02721 [Rhamnella rubrinervis]|uniref:Uncharacterized protein n=1 Tax=Rhamnella rubrinervis TaxID=2594499 RepID=A0A8K0MNL1_9ROSA|nr:hypothetical protein FNV43_RR02721 [Rhamnella rubrinervis]
MLSLAFGIFPVSHNDVEKIRLPFPFVGRRRVLVDHLPQKHVESPVQPLHPTLNSCKSIHAIDGMKSPMLKNPAEVMSSTTMSLNSFDSEPFVTKTRRLSITWPIMLAMGTSASPHHNRLASLARVVHGSQHVTELDLSYVSPVVQSFSAEHVQVTELPQQLPPWTVVGEHHVLCVISQVGGTGIRRTGHVWHGAEEWKSTEHRPAFRSRRELLGMLLVGEERMEKRVMKKMRIAVAISLRSKIEEPWRQDKNYEAKPNHYLQVQKKFTRLDFLWCTATDGLPRTNEISEALENAAL